MYLVARLAGVDDHPALGVETGQLQVTLPHPAVEAGADDVTFDDETVEIFGPVEAFKEISDRLRNANIHPEEAELRFVPNNEVELSPEDSIQVLRVVESLEEHDDVQNVYSTLYISEQVMAQFEEA